MTRNMRRFPSRLRRCGRGWSIPRRAGRRRRNGITAVVVTPFLDDAGKQRARPLAIVPAFSVMLEPGTQVISTHNGSTSNVLTASRNVTSDLAITTHWRLCGWNCPQGWRSEPAQFAVEFTRRGEKQERQFKVFPAGLQEGRATIRAVLDVGRRRNTARDTRWSRARIWGVFIITSRRGSA